MGTRSTIGIKSEDGTVKAIYCHWDGYPEGVGAGLVQSYNTPQQVAELINLGGISSLQETMEETAKTAYGTPSDSARTFKNVSDWLENFNSGEEYFYLYEASEGWAYSTGRTFLSLKTEEVTA
jgi:hypothetical protein